MVGYFFVALAFQAAAGFAVVDAKFVSANYLPFAFLLAVVALFESVIVH